MRAVISQHSSATLSAGGSSLAELAAHESPPEEAATRAALDAEQLLRLLYRQLRCLAGPRPDLDDIVQMAAERALKALVRFEGRSSLSTWTYGVAYRTLLDHDRWYARFRRRFSSSDDEAPQEPRTRCDSEALLVEAQRAQRLHAALSQLSAPKRAVVVLHDMEGLAAREVAEIVGANVNTVRSRLHDARAKLASLLADDPLFQGEGEP